MDYLEGFSRRISDEVGSCPLSDHEQYLQRTFPEPVFGIIFVAVQKNIRKI